jgi:hypothetical protein
MGEEKFWQIIEEIKKQETKKVVSVGHGPLQKWLISERLKLLGIEAIVAFQKILSQKIRDLYLPKIGEIFLLASYELDRGALRGSRYISTDGFLDFRAWILSLGRLAYEPFRDFSREEEIIDFNLNPDIAYRAELIFLTSALCEELNEEVDLNFHYDLDEINLFPEMIWSGLDEKYPKLYEIYQNRRLNSTK